MNMKQVRSKITRREKLMKRYRISYEDVSTILEREKKEGFTYEEAMELIAAVKTLELRFGFSYDDAWDMKTLVEKYSGSYVGQKTWKHKCIEI